MQRVCSGRPGWPPPRRRGGGGSVVISAPVMSGLSSDFRVGRGARAGAKAGEENEASDLGGPLEAGV